LPLGRVRTVGAVARRDIAPRGGRAVRPSATDATPADAGRAGWRALLGAWVENYKARRQLQRCLSLDPRFAKDIGLTAGEIEMECRAPFWVPVPRVTRVKPAGHAS